MKPQRTQRIAQRTQRTSPSCSFVVPFVSFVVTLLFLSFQADAQEPVATATLDTNNMLIGDQINLNLQFTGPLGVQVLWPVIPDTLLGNIELLELGRIDTLPVEQKTPVTYSQNILLTTFDSGFYVIPPIPFYYRILPDTTVFLTETRTQSLAVHTLAVDTTKPIKPIKGPKGIPMTFRELLPWILVGLAVVIAIAFLVYYVRKRRKREPVFRFRPRMRLSPHEMALAELEKLRVKKLWQAGRVKEYYTELTDILREYIEQRFDIPAMESTSDEILQDLLTVQEVSPESWDELGKILMLADLVKFAKERPLPDQNEDSLEKGILFVNHTAIPHELASIPQTEDTPQRRGDAEDNSNDRIDV